MGALSAQYSATRLSGSQESSSYVLNDTKSTTRPAGKYFRFAEDIQTTCKTCLHGSTAFRAKHGAMLAHADISHEAFLASQLYLDPLAQVPLCKWIFAASKVLNLQTKTLQSSGCLCVDAHHFLSFVTSLQSRDRSCTPLIDCTRQSAAKCIFVEYLVAS